MSGDREIGRELVPSRDFSGHGRQSQGSRRETDGGVKGEDCGEPHRRPGCWL